MKMASLMDLPYELILKIYSFLPPESICVFSQVCKSLCATSHDESLWKEMCLKDFGISQVSCDYISYRDLYTALLHPYGKLLGLWKSGVYPYGGILSVKYESGCLNAYEVHAPVNSHITKESRMERLFTISIGANKLPRVYCCGGQYGHHEAKISEKDVDGFTFTCLSLTRDRLSDFDSNNHSSVLYNWLSVDDHNHARENGPEGVLYLELLFVKFFKISTYNHNYSYKRLILPQQVKNVPIQPGIFKGTYSSHGVEFILLTYEDNVAKATKISGDPNVPAGEMTFEVDMDDSMILTPKQQDKLHQLADIDVEKVRTTGPGPHNQHFQVPLDCIVRFKQVPTTCSYRFFGQGQIAHDGFLNPSLTPGHWVVFSEDMFGFLWIDLAVLSIYFRAKEIS